MDKYEYEQMCKEIVSNSVGVWDDTLEYTEEGILLDKLWEILTAYINIEPDGDQDKQKNSKGPDETNHYR